MSLGTTDLAALIGLARVVQEAAIEPVQLAAIAYPFDTPPRLTLVLPLGKAQTFVEHLARGWGIESNVITYDAKTQLMWMGLPLTITETM